MKKMFYLAFILLMAVEGISIAQELQYKEYDWEAEPRKFDASAAQRKWPDLFLKEKYSIEYFYNEKGELEEYKLIHKIMLLNDDVSIEKFNKIYIPAGADVSFVRLKARVITPAGKINLFSEKDVREAVDEKSKIKYRFFAFEGIEKGSVIEYLYFIRIRPAYSGTQVLVQSKSPKFNIEYEIISPINLIFASKSYNGLPELVSDSSVKEKNILRLKLDSLAELKEEDNTTYDANLCFFVYKLSGNTATGSKDINSYGAISEAMYKTVMALPEKGVQKKIKKYAGQMNLDYAKDEQDKLRMVEKYLKANIGIIDNEDDRLSDISFILENKAANKEGMAKIFAAVFNQLGIDYQVVLTCDRQLLKFDPKFESYNFLTDYLFYFPSLDKYICPYDIISCLGFIPDNFTYNYGLFIKKMQLDNFETAIGKIKFIDHLPYDQTYDNTFVKLDFSSDVLKPSINLRREMGGYYAQNFQPYYSYMPEDDKKKLNESLVKDFIKNTDVEKLSVENEGKDYFGIYPFIVKSELKSHTLVEVAGAKFLLKLGELIGPQMEMYQKEERKQPVENDYARSYHREITFDLPAGYKITNLHSLDMDVFMEENDQRIIAFTSKYELKEKSIKIIVDEYYKKIFYPVSQFENYRKVINAAADFNKIILFLEKEI